MYTKHYSTTENTPRTTNGLSPAQVMLQRKTGTATLPQSPEYFATDEAARDAKQRRQRSIKAAQDKFAPQLPALSIGARVWFVTLADGKRPGELCNVLMTEIIPSKTDRIHTRKPSTREPR